MVDSVRGSFFAGSFNISGIPPPLDLEPSRPYHGAMDDSTVELEALRGLTNPAEIEAVASTLRNLTKDTELLLFIGPGCPVCPHQVRSVATLALATPRISLEIVDVTQDRELAAQYEVHAVPTTVVDDELIMVGVVPAGELAWRLLEREGPEAEKVVFAALVESGRIADAAERLSDGRAVEAFVELWSRSTLEGRMGLFLVAEEALQWDPDSLDSLVPLLIRGLEGDGPLAQDPSRKGDTADLLGQIGNPEARAVLQWLSGDANEEVAEAAREALEELG
jgi:thiol-disulfide isomerase/thioredoxin